MRYPPLNCVILFVVAFLIFSSGLGLRDPWAPDEPRFALVAKEMVSSGHWLLPTRGGELYPDKPPFFMWCIAVFYALTHVMRFAFLLPSLLAALGTLFLTYDLAKRLWGRDMGWIAGAVLLSLFQFTLQAKTAQIDGVLCFWTTLGFYGLIRHLLLGPNWRWYSISGLAIGFGVITKGVGILPWFILIPYAVLAFRRWSFIPSIPCKNKRWLLGPAAALLVIGCWLVPLLWLSYQSQNAQLLEYRNNILFHQTITRYAHAWHHLEPFWYYLIVVAPWAWFPVTLALPWLLPRWWLALKNKDARLGLLLGWMICVLLFFSISPGKRGVYILPIAPALALATAPFLKELWSSVRLQKLASGFLLSVSALLVGSGIYEIYKPTAMVLQQPVIPYFFLGFGSLGFIVWSLRGWQQSGLTRLTVFLGLFWMGYGWVTYPVINAVRSAEPLMVQVQQQMGPGATLGMVAWKEQLLLHAPAGTVVFGFRKDLQQQWREAIIWLSKDSNYWLLAPKDSILWPSLAACSESLRSIDLGYRYRQTWYLLHGCRA